MFARSSGLLRTTLTAALTALSLGVVACGDGDEPRALAKSAPPPTVARDVPAVVAPAPLTKRAIDGAIGAQAEPTPAPAPVEVAPAKASEPIAALDFDGHMAAGRKAYGEGEHRVALEHFEQAAIVKPKSSTARVQVARALLALGEKIEARTFCEQALERDPKSGLAWNTMGRIDLAAQDLPAAIASFRRATEEDAASGFAWNNLGYALMATGDYQQAVLALESATATAAPTPYMWNNLGMAYEHLERVREARAAYRQAAGLGSEKGEVNVGRLEGVRALTPSAVAVAPVVAIEPAPAVTPAVE